MSDNLELVLRKNSHSLPVAVIQSKGGRISITHNGISIEDMRDLLIMYLYWVQDCINENEEMDDVG